MPEGNKDKPKYPFCQAGSGKTHLAVVALREIATRGFSVCFRIATSNIWKQGADPGRLGDLLAPHLSQRVYSRRAEMCLIVPVVGPDYRTERRQPVWRMTRGTGVGTEIRNENGSSGGDLVCSSTPIPPELPDSEK